MAVEVLEFAAHALPAATIFVLDDATSDGTYDELKRYAERRSEVHLSRNSVPNGFIGLSRSVLRVLHEASGTPFDLIIKFDPDALLIHAAYVERIWALFQEQGPGMAGSYRISADGKHRDFSPHRRDVLLDIPPIGVTRRGGWNALRVGWPAYIRYLPAALRNGYQLGEHCLGGMYALHGATVQALRTSGFLDLHRQPLNARLVAEDALVALGVKSVGHALIDANNPKTTPFTWVQYRPPFPLSAAEILQHGIAAVHPLKGEQGREIRAALRPNLETPVHV